MSLVWFFAKLILFTFFLNVLLRQSYNFIFFSARKPVLWIVIVALLSFGVVALSASMGASIDLVFWAYVLALGMNTIPGSKHAEATQEVATAAEVIYSEVGIAGGRQKYRLGLICFALAGVLAYGLFYGESCSSNGVCVPLVSLVASG